MGIHTINPATEAVLQTYSFTTAEQLNTIITAGHQRYQAWKLTSFNDRAQLLRNIALLLRKNKADYASLVTAEMGKPLTAAIKEIEKCAWVCEHYADHAEAYLAPHYIKTDMHTSKVCYQPLGILFAIMPWNFPFWQVFRFAAPTLMAGNVVLLKHASICSGTGLAIQQLFLDAGAPKHLFQTVLIDPTLVENALADDRVIAVTLTGSEAAGQSVAATAGKHLKKCVLELGGNDPCVVLEDADLSLAADCILRSRLNNTGQVCIAAKRIIVLDAVADALIQMIMEKIKTYRMGDPTDPKTQLGPMARRDLRDAVHKQVLQTQALGAHVLLGGTIPDGIGFYYPATVLTDVRPGMPAFDDEIFGPVIAITRVENEAMAIRLANETRYGLGASVFTSDIARGEIIATSLIESGVCFLNAVVSSDPRLPFGGIKRSGYGRELSREGILEFVNIKTVAMNHG